MIRCDIFKSQVTLENYCPQLALEQTSTLLIYKSVFSDKMGLMLFFLFLSSTPAYIPTPIYFGAVIDTTCMLWQQECGVQGSCWEYNVTSFRFVYFGLAAGLKFVGFIFIFLAWYSIKYKEDELQRQRWREFPLSTVSEMVGHTDNADKYARTRSCPAFSSQGAFHEETGLQKGIPYTAQTYPGPFPEAISSSPDPGLEESPTAMSPPSWSLKKEDFSFVGWVEYGNLRNTRAFFSFFLFLTSKDTILKPTKLSIHSHYWLRAGYLNETESLSPPSVREGGV